ncbi:MAG: AraC family transcriptional regulator [Bifidobacteriaceae bacterium]|jgi:AraC-like DNA-binding protein|nr:AraC family transcriptional regulator [Bifidobacteriaceae bacterium]
MSNASFLEDILPFSNTQLPSEDRFFIDLVGITYPDKTYKVHWNVDDSPCYVCEYVISGEGNVICGGEQFFPKGGDVYILPPHMQKDYRSSPSDPYKKIWMNVGGSLCDALYEQYGLKNHFYYPERALYNLFKSFFTLCKDYASNPKYVAFHGPLIIHELFASLAQNPEKQLSISSVYATKAKEFIDVNIQANLKTEDIASAIGISVSQLTRYFFAEYSTTPYKYYTANRFNLARKLLRNSALPVKAISHKLNFADEHYFSYKFKEETGVSPKTFRQQNYLDKTDFS